MARRVSIMPAGKPVTAQQVAAAAGVSISAVSRTFTKDASVSPAMRQRVLDAAQQLGYRPNHLARSLMTGRTELVGLVSNHFGNPAFMPIFDGFTRAFQARGLRPLLANLGHDGGAQAALDMLLQYNVDAVLIATSAPPAGFAASCAAAGLPVLHLFGRPDAVAGVPVVTVDNIAGGRIAAEAMVACGLRRLVFIGGAAHDASSQDRAAGFAQGLRMAGIAPLQVHYAGDYSHEHGQQALHHVMDVYPSVDGIFCGDDILALGVLDACRERGIDVPGQLGVVGFDDMPLAAWPSYRLTTVAQPMAAMALDAVERIADWLQPGATAPASRLFDCRLVERATLQRSR